MHDGEAIGASCERYVEQPRAVAFVEDRSGFDHDDRIELHAFRLPGGEDTDPFVGHLDGAGRQNRHLSAVDLSGEALCSLDRCHSELALRDVFHFDWISRRPDR